MLMQPTTHQSSHSSAGVTFRYQSSTSNTSNTRRRLIFSNLVRNPTIRARALDILTTVGLMRHKSVSLTLKDITHDCLGLGTCNRPEPNLFEHGNKTCVNKRILPFFTRLTWITFYDDGSPLSSIVNSSFQQLRGDASSSEGFGHKEAHHRPDWFVINSLQCP